MISYPKPGQQVQIRYGQKNPCGNHRWQDHIGTVAIPGRGRPRNHGVMVDGVVVVIPAGNLREPPAPPHRAVTQTQFQFTP